MFLYESAFFSATGYLNPIKQMRVVKAHEEKMAQEKERYTALYNKVLDLADNDKEGSTGFLSFGEQVDAWKRMGYTNTRYIASEGSRQFAIPSMEDLEKAIASYEADNSK